VRNSFGIETPVDAFSQGGKSAFEQWARTTLALSAGVGVVCD